MQKNSAAKEPTSGADHPEKSRTISQLGRLFGLSRSALLYYDRIGLLKPSERTEAGYRCYSGADRRRLERICGFRRAGLALEEIRTILASEGKPSAAILERRFHEIGEEIHILKAKQGLLSHMLAGMASAKCPSAVDRDLWVEMLRAAGMDDKAMARWHAEFEQRAPEAHREFLLSLGIPEGEVLEIRKWSRWSAAKEDGSAEQAGRSTTSANPAAGHEERTRPVRQQKTKMKHEKGVVS